MIYSDYSFDDSEKLTYESIIEYIGMNNIWSLNAMVVLMDPKLAKTPGLAVNGGSGIDSKGYSFPFSDVIFVTGEAGSCGPSKTKVVDNGKRVSLLQLALNEILEGRTPWLGAIGYTRDVLKVMLMTGNFKMQTLMNVVNFQTIAVKKNGDVVFP